MSCFYGEEKLFAKEKFQAPPLAFAPVYSWIWNGPVSREETDRQLAEMRRLGIKAAYIIPEPKSFRPKAFPTLLEPDYLTPAYFEEYRYAAKKAKEMGMVLWLYDEGGWPSGGACGKVLIKHPEFARKSLASRKKTYAAGEKYEATVDTAAAFLENGEQIDTGHVFEEDGEVTEYYSRRSLFEEPAHPDLPDLTRKEATEAFLKMTHEEYKPYLHEFFGNLFTAVFTDEPTAPRPVPFREEIEEEFIRRYGYSIRPFFPELLGEKEIGAEAAQARIDWYDLCSEMFCRNYLLAEKEWANKNGMAFTGHVDRDDKPLGCMDGGNFHALRALRCFDVPGIDVIWRQIFPAERPAPFNEITGITCENGFFPRYASSAAAQIGAVRALTESFGVYGAGLTFDQMRYILNFQAVRGINVYNLLGIPYGREGFLMVGELPFFTENHACYEDISVFNEYVERLSYVSSLGDSANSVALYMPVRDFWAGERVQECAADFEKAGFELERAQIPFDVFDDDVIANADPAALDRGVISMGKARYTALVIPPCKHMRKESENALARFIKGGGKVFVISGCAAPSIHGAVTVENARNVLKAPLKLSGDLEWIRLAERTAENGRMFLLYNQSVSASEVSVYIKEDVTLLDLQNGGLHRPRRAGDTVELTLRSGELACLWLSEDGCDAEEVPVFTAESIYDGKFTFRRSRRFIIDEMNYRIEDIAEDECPIELGDWKAAVGEGFSGTGCCML